MQAIGSIRSDHGLTFLIDVMNLTPTIPLIIVIGMTYGGNLWTVYTVIALLSWQGDARIIRQWVISLRSRPTSRPLRLSELAGGG